MAVIPGMHWYESLPTKTRKKPRGGRPRALDDVVARLNARPNEWAAVATALTIEAAKTRTYRYRRYYPNYEFEYRYIDRVPTIFARYVGN